MNPLVFFTLWTLVQSQGSAAPPEVHPQNIVRICSTATGTGCQDLDARLLEPTAAATAASGKSTG